jgi:hypothetical protein
MPSNNTTIEYSSGKGATPARGSTPRVLLAWAVTIPALWGIAMTIRTSTQLFKTPAAQTTAAPNAAPAAR